MSEQFDKSNDLVVSENELDQQVETSLKTESEEGINVNFFCAG